MYSFGSSSRKRLETCDPRLIELAEEAIKYIDFSVICGHRTQEEQNNAVHSGFSKVEYPNSKHNSIPSKAMDLAPYPIDWENTTRFAFLMGTIKGIALSKGIKVRFGGDWDSDGDITDHDFMDWPHIELVD